MNQLNSKDGRAKGSKHSKPTNNKTESVRPHRTFLWNQWWTLVQELRPACSRQRTYFWMVAAILGFCTRTDLAGATSWVRAGFLNGNSYRSFLNLFRSTALDLTKLTEQWIRIVLTRFQSLEVHGHRIAVVDGLKVAKEGRKMPGVKALHQQSTNNSKAEFIMGHSYQAIGLLVEATKSVLCVPLASRLHEGLKRSPSEKATLLDKAIMLFQPVAKHLEKPVILLADAYYASQKIVLPLLEEGHHLLTRVRSNAVAYKVPVQPKKRGRGRPRKYGKKVHLGKLWDRKYFQTAKSPVYDDKDVEIRYLVQDLLWRPAKTLVRYVLVDHPTRGRLILMTTKIDLDPIEIIRLYSYRFKIEVSFKSALHTLGTYAYRFWLKGMKKIKRRDGDQHLHRKSPDYRDSVWRKVHSYELHVQLGLISQGLLQCLAVNHRQTVWRRFGSWMRTMRPEVTPSEAVVAQSLRFSLVEFLAGSAVAGIFVKFLRDRVDWERVPGAVLVT